MCILDTVEPTTNFYFVYTHFFVTENINCRRFNVLLYAYKLALMISLSCKKFKIIFTPKRGYKGRFICIQKNIKSVAIF